MSRVKLIQKFTSKSGSYSNSRSRFVGAVSVGSVSYVALFPSLLSFLFWNRAVLLVGPNRAGQFIHLIPVFGTLLSVLLLGERLFAYHLVGIVTVASGILMATRYGRRSES